METETPSEELRRINREHLQRTGRHLYTPEEMARLLIDIRLAEMELERLQSVKEAQEFVEREPTPLHLDIDHLESPHATEAQMRSAETAGLEFTPYFESDHWHEKMERRSASRSLDFSPSFEI